MLNFGCCSGHAGCDNYSTMNEFQVNLSSDMQRSNMPHPVRDFDPLQRADSFDVTFTPRTIDNHQQSRTTPITPRQRGLRDKLDLPQLHAYPVPPHCSPDADEEERQQCLLDMYQEFALDLHTGMYLTQLTSSRDYSDIHCQLMEDMQTLKLDQTNGRIIEFPLVGVSKVYRIVKNNDKWYSAGTAFPGTVAGDTEHIVVVEFMRRKLAFVFKELQVSQRFLMCMELLIRRAQQAQAKKTPRGQGSAAAFPLTPSKDSASRQQART